MDKPNKRVGTYLKKIQLPAPNSHKGQNGKLLIIGGSQLFHAASKWSLDIASKFVDMVFYSSIPQNNKLIQQAKQNFWNGIVIPRKKIEEYIEEADCILIGPGMERQITKKIKLVRKLTAFDWNHNTKKIADYLLKKYPHKKWVVDAGAVQMINPKLLNKNCIITPHQLELKKLINKIKTNKKIDCAISLALNKTTLIVKGPTDSIITPDTVINIIGGNAGMTKGGTGDVLAGLVAALYCKHDSTTSAVVASYINKKAGDELYKKVGPYFNASDLVEMIPSLIWQKIKKSKS